MHVKELAARFERPVAVQKTSANVVPTTQLSGSSVSELRQRLEQAVIDEQSETQNDNYPNRRADTLQPPSRRPNPTNEVRGLSVPILATAPPTPLPSDFDNQHSTIPSIGDAPFQQMNEHCSTPVDPEPQRATGQHPSQLSSTAEQQQASVLDEEQSLGEPMEPARMPSEFTAAYSTHSESMASGSTAPPASDFVPQTIEDVGIIPDVSEGELDDIDGIERVDDYDSQEDNQSSCFSHDDQNDTFQRAETLSDPHVSYRTEGGESLHIVDGSYSYHESEGSYDESSNEDGDDSGDEHHVDTATAERVNTLGTQDQSHRTYSGYSYSPNMAPLSSFHTSTVPSQVLFSRATTSSTSEGFKSANDDFASEAEHSQRIAALNSGSPNALHAETNPHCNPTIAFASVHSPPPAPSPPMSAHILHHSAPLERTSDYLSKVGAEEEADPDVNSRNRLYTQGSVKRLPKAKVLIARRRGHSVNLDTSTIGSSNEQPEARATASADEIGRRRLVREISNAGDFFAGQVSMVQRISEKDIHVPEGSQGEEDDSPPSPRRKPFGDLSTFHRKQLRQDAFRKRYDEYLDAEDLNRAAESDESSTSESELLGDRGASKMKYRPRMKLFGRKNAAAGRLEKERLRAKRHEKRKEDIARRSTILSGALDRVSMAADPWIDFITDAKAMPVPEKARGSLRRAVKRLFGAKGKHQTLIKD